MSFEKFTEQPGKYRHLDKMSVHEILHHINEEDKTVPFAVEKAIPQIEKLASIISNKMLDASCSAPVPRRARRSA